MTDTPWDAIIIGGGSTGLSAALQLGRLRARVLVLDAGEPRNRFAGHMHGVLGRDHTSPLDLLADGRRELERYGVPVLGETVAAVQPDTDGFVVTTTAVGAAPGTGSTTRRTRRLLVATGLRDRLPDIDGLAARWGRDVFSCPFCDGWEHRDLAIGVIATTPEQRHQIMLLRRLTDRLTVLTDGGQPFGPDDLAAMLARGIVVDDRRIATISGETPRVHLADGGAVDFDVLFVRGAPEPFDQPLVDVGARRGDGGWFVVDELGRTSVPGVWAAGNVVNPMLNVPAAIAAGAMAGAAMCGDLLTEPLAIEEPAAGAR